MGYHIITIIMTSRPIKKLNFPTPRGEFARSLANFEALLGQIYLTVLVARLVGRNLTHSMRKRSEEAA